MNSMKKEKAIREYFGLSQEDMAMLLQVTRSQYSLFELGKRSLPTKVKLELASMLSYLKETSYNDKTTPKQNKEQLAERQKMWKEELIINQHKQKILEEKIQRMEKKHEAAKATLLLADYLDKNKNFKDYRDTLASSFRSKALSDIEKNNIHLQEKHKMQLENLKHFNEEIQKIIKSANL